MLNKKKSWLSIPTLLLIVSSLIPFFIMIIGAFKPSMALYKIPANLNLFINMSLTNIINVLNKVDFFTAFKNSFIISSGVCLLTVIVGTCGGYVFAKHNFKGKKILFIIMMATMMVPKQIMLIPNFIVADKLSLDNTLIGIILTSINSGYAIFLCKQFMTSIPNEILEAAKLDGSSEFKTFIKIILPMCKPVIAALVIFTFISSWNDFVWQNIMLTSKELRTVPIALAYLDSQTDAITNLGNKMAGATISSIPMILIFVCFQKFFIKGVTAGGVKE